MEIEALLKKIEQVTAQFGRAQQDLEALVSRGRSKDYKGVLQNTRLVVEMLLRSMVTTELKQTPGKAMLDELISKFRQQANAGIIPTNILAHMGTVQAWGNLSSHDHAGGLHEEGVRVGLDEAMTALNSMVAILSWYVQKYPPQPSPSAAPSVGVGATTPAPQTQPSRSSKGPVLVSGLALVVVGGAVAAFVLLRANGSSAEQARKALDAHFLAHKEPVPPPACQTKDPAVLDKLAGVLPKLSPDLPDGQRQSEALAATAMLETAAVERSPEHWTLIARARAAGGGSSTDAIAQAVRCEGFAAAENLAGVDALRRKALPEATQHFNRALRSAPEFLKPRFGLGVIAFQGGELAKALEHFEEVTRKDAAHADAHYSAARIHELLATSAKDRGEVALAQHEERAAKDAYCQAFRAGKTDAKDRCERP